MPGQDAVERRRGGNRLPVGHPARGRPPVYTRCRALPVDPERRDKRQRERVRRALGWALERGELPPRLMPAMEAMLELTDERCNVTWHSLARIGRHAGGFDERTVGGWLAELRQLGWVQRQHRFIVIEGGRVRGTSNFWRIDIPTHLRTELLDAEANKRARTTRQRAHGGGRTTSRPTAGAGGGGRRDPAFSPEMAAAALAEDAAVRRENLTRRAAPDDPAKRAEARRRVGHIRAAAPVLKRGPQPGRSPP